MSEAGANAALLIVEDEAMIAMFLEQEAERAGYRLLPTQGNVADALRAVEASPPDVAILDMHLCGEAAYPVADALMALGVPFVFTSGREAILPPRYRGVPCVSKPFAFDDVMGALARAKDGR